MQQRLWCQQLLTCAVYRAIAISSWLQEVKAALEEARSALTATQHAAEQRAAQAAQQLVAAARSHEADMKTALARQVSSEEQRSDRF